MTQVIIYPNNEGGVHVVHPTPEALSTLAFEEIIAKSVPEGMEYKIINASELPQDRTFRNAWEMQE
jgi:hypothetical protein